MNFHIFNISREEGNLDLRLFHRVLAYCVFPKPGKPRLLLNCAHHPMVPFKKLPPPIAPWWVFEVVLKRKQRKIR